MINCKVELKLNGRSILLCAAGDDDDDDDDDNIILTIKDKLYVPVVTLSVRDNQKLLNFLTKDLKYQFIGMNVIQKSENKNMTNEFRYFLKRNFVGINRLLTWQSRYLKMDAYLLNLVSHDF